MRWSCLLRRKRRAQDVAKRTKPIIGIAGPLFCSRDQIGGMMLHRLDHPSLGGQFIPQGRCNPSLLCNLLVRGADSCVGRGNAVAKDMKILEKLIERGTPVDDQPETHLFLLSIGLEWLPTEARTGVSIPALVDVLHGSLGDGDSRAAFLDRVKQYGGDASIGYDHEEHRDLPRFRRPFHARFERLYDMDDMSIRLLRSKDLEHATHIDQGSVTFRVRLPQKVRGDVNPLSGMGPITGRIIDLMGG